MLAQMILAAEALLANVAHVLLQPRVDGLHVSAQIRLVMELLGAQLALVRLVLGAVATQMRGVDILALEALAALLAAERVLTGVEALVVLREVAVLGELLVALQTLYPSGGQGG